MHRAGWDQNRPDTSRALQVHWAVRVYYVASENYCVRIARPVGLGKLEAYPMPMLDGLEALWRSPIAGDSPALKQPWLESGFSSRSPRFVDMYCVGRELLDRR